MNTPPIHRRSLLALLGAALLAACATPPASEAKPPIVFVHGNGDSAALWTPTLWRWQSNGWPRERLHAVNFPYPQARDDDTREQAGRSSANDQMRHLAAEVDKVLAATGAVKVVLIGNSRGGNAIRNYIANGGGAAKVSHAVLGGTPNHGVWADPAFLPNSEFNGAGPFLKAMNAPQGPDGNEVTPGPAWMTVRSDDNDKFAQPDGVWIGRKGIATRVGFDSPALKGALNQVLAVRDHREVSYHPEAFVLAHRFVTGRAPVTTTPTHVTPETKVTLSGLVTGYAGGSATNLPLPGAQLTVFAVDAGTGARRGAPLLAQTIAADGRWGPLATDSATPLEFVLEASGHPTAHIYRAPFARSADTVNLRPERPLAGADKEAAALVNFTRPRAYFGLPRDTIVLDGQPAPGVPTGVAGVAESKLRLKDGADRPVVAEFRSGVISERIAGRVWPTASGHVTVLELHE